MAANEEEDFDPPPSPATFVIRNKLSHGSYGVVFRGELNKKPVAVKKIHSTLLNEEGSERLLKAFKNECRYLKSLDHPNVVKFMGAYRDKEGPLLVMELMKESLEEFLKKNKGNLSFRRQLDICNSIAKGLVFLHDREKPIIHRDLNDKNVLLAEDGTVKIADFGQSKLIDKPGQFLMSTQQPGAVAYMPPEALDDDPRYTPSVDTFSLGVLMLEIATQQPPQVGLTKIGSKPEVLRRANNLKVLSDGHVLKPLIIWCLQECDSRPSVATVHNQTSTLRALEEKTGLADVKVIEQLKERLTEEVKSKEELEEEILTYTQIIEQYRSDFDAERKDREAAAGKFADREKEWMEKIRRAGEERDHLKALNTQLEDGWMEQIGRAKEYRGHLDPAGLLQEEIARRRRDELESLRRELKRSKEMADGMAKMIANQEAIFRKQEADHRNQEADYQKQVATLRNQLEDLNTRWKVEFDAKQRDVEGSKMTQEAYWHLFDEKKDLELKLREATEAKDSASQRITELERENQTLKEEIEDTRQGLRQTPQVSGKPTSQHQAVHISPTPSRKRSNTNPSAYTVSEGSPEPAPLGQTGRVSSTMPRERSNTTQPKVSEGSPEPAVLGQTGRVSSTKPRERSNTTQPKITNSDELQKKLMRRRVMIGDTQPDNSCGHLTEVDHNEEPTNQSDFLKSSPAAVTPSNLPSPRGPPPVKPKPKKST